MFTSHPYHLKYSHSLALRGNKKANLMLKYRNRITTHELCCLTWLLALLSFGLIRGFSSTAVDYVGLNA